MVAGATAAVGPLSAWAASQESTSAGGQVGSQSTGQPAGQQPGSGGAANGGKSPATAKIAPGMDLLGAGSLKAHAEAKGLLFGFAVNSRLLRESEPFRQAVSSQCNVVVGENCMKWGALRPTATTYDFADADALVSFAEEHGIKVRGHNLCWHENLPGWFAATATRDNAAQLLTDHIRTVVGRYKGRVQSWDVVNEAVHPKDGRPDGLRATPWLELIGPGYIDLAFRTARETDPAALLCLNDFGLEYDTAEEMETRAAIVRLLKRMQDARTPIDAVGVQSHLRATDVIKLGDGIRGFANQMRRMKLAVYITELDVNADSLPDLETLQFDRDVASVYRRYLDAVLESPATRAIVTWGLPTRRAGCRARSGGRNIRTGRSTRCRFCWTRLASTGPNRRSLRFATRWMERSAGRAITAREDEKGRATAARPF